MVGNVRLYSDVRQINQSINGTSKRPKFTGCIHNYPKFTYILCDMHYTLHNILTKRQTYCKSGRRGTKKAFLTKGYTAWLKNGD